MRIRVLVRTGLSTDMKRLQHLLFLLILQNLFFAALSGEPAGSENSTVTYVLLSQLFIIQHLSVNHSQ